MQCDYYAKYLDAVINTCINLLKMIIFRKYIYQLTYLYDLKSTNIQFSMKFLCLQFLLISFSICLSLYQTYFCLVQTMILRNYKNATLFYFRHIFSFLEFALACIILCFPSLQYGESTSHNYYERN